MEKTADSNVPSELSGALSVYLNRIKSIKLISQDQEIVLGKKIQSGDSDALKGLVEANLRFVVTIALKYKKFGMPLIDLINEGNVGLIQAAKRFDPGKNVKFISYAVWWIRQSIIQALSEKGFSTRIPPKQVTKLRRIRRERLIFLKGHGREATVDELKLSTGYTKKDIGFLSGVQTHAFSLDDKVTSTSDSKFIDFLKSNEKSIEEQITSKSMIDRIRHAIKSLSERSQLIILRRYGLDGKKANTLREIGAELKISKERVRQLENEAIAKLHQMLSE